MKVAIYCRVSTESQYQKGVSIKDQKQRGIEFCIEKNYEYEVFEELATSGTKPVEERPKLFELLKRTERKKIKNKKEFEKPEFEGLYIVDFDRVSREERQYPVIKHHFVENGITIFDKGQVVDLRDADTNLMVNIKGSLGAYEIAKMKERVKRALERSVIDGKAGGGPIINYGYCKRDDKMLIIEEEEANVVRMIYDLCLKGIGSKRIANELNELKIPTKRSKSKTGTLKVKGKLKKEFIWRDSVVYRILTNSIYCGERNYKGKIYKCPAIIDKRTYQLVQEILKERKHYVNTTNKHTYLLKGLILCPICKNLFFGRRREDLSDNQYCCSSQRYSDFCGNRGINIDKIEKIVWKSILELPERIKSIVVDKNDDYVKSLKEEIEKAKQLLINLEVKKNRMVEEIFRNEKLSTTFQKNLDSLAENIEYYTQKIQDNERQLEMSNQHGTLIKVLKKQLTPLKNQELEFEEKQRIVRSFISYVLVKWSELRGEHLIWTQFRISELSDLNIQGLSKITYDKLGFSFREKKIVYEFRVGSLKPVVEDLDGSGRTYSFEEGVKDEFFTIEDFSENQYENFKELMWKARKRKGITNP
jgi:site-specific DNA recombinase